MWHSVHDLLAPYFETPHGTRQSIPAIEGLRGFATLLVFSAHYATLIEPWMNHGTATWNIARFGGAVGHSGVDLFFLLSGFLIYGGLIRRQVPLGMYFRRRINRIYPTFTAVFVAYIAACWLVPTESKLPADIQQAVSYLAINYLLLAEILGIPPLITVSWSLSFEMLFYVACPLVVTCLRLREWRSWTRSFLIAVVASTVLALAPFLETYTRMALFCGGMLLYERPREVDVWKHPWICLIASGIGAAAVFQVSAQDMGHGLWSAATALLFLPLCHAALQRENLLASIFSWLPLRWFGNMSYSFFLLHGLTLKGMFFFIEQSVSEPAGNWSGMFWLLLPIAFLNALWPSIALFLTVERPLSLAPARGIGGSASMVPTDRGTPGLP